MEKIEELYSEYKEYILFLLLLIIFLIGSAGIFYYFKNDISKLRKEIKAKPITEVKQQENNDEFYSVDIKGEVRKPGVYTLKKGKRVIDQTTPNMIQRISRIFERKPLISKGI